MSKKRRHQHQHQHQKGTMKLNQYTDGLVAVSVNVHDGRVTRRIFGPASDDGEMALSLFRPALKDLKKTL